MILDVAAVIAKLDELVQAGTSIAFAGGIGALADAPENTTVSESAFAMPPTVLGGAQAAACTVTTQRVAISFGIALVFLGIGASGGDQTAVIQRDAQAVFDAFFGWTPDASIYSPAVLQTAGTEDVDTEKGFLIYSLTFQTTANVRA